ncbi:hypothetical protein ES703_58621 [subsurface metagenome]
MALRPEDPPAWSTFGGARIDKLIYVAGHIFDIERKRQDVPAVPALVSIDRCVFDLW